MRAVKGLLVAVLMTAPCAHGDVIFNNGSPNPVTGGGLSDLDAGVRQGDDFALLSGASTITGFRWYGFQGSPSSAPDDFTVEIYATTGGAPDAAPAHVLHVGEAGKMPGDTPDHFVYEAMIAPLFLDPGVTFVLSIYNHTAPGFEDDWSWYTSGEGDGFVWLGQDLLQIDRDFAFAILGPPIPPAPAFGPLGLFAAATSLARRRRAW